MSTAVGTMKIFMDTMQKYSDNSTVESLTMLDDAVRTVSPFANLQDAINHFVSDVSTSNSNEDSTTTLTRLSNTCGIVLGGIGDFTADTGAISGYNAGGATVKNAQSIVPETSDLTNLDLPTAGSTTTQTYTGADGKTFTFYVKWPDSFNKIYDFSGLQEIEEDDDFFLELTNEYTYPEDEINLTGSQIASGINTVLKGLYHFWLEQSFKLAYDSYGLDFGGKTIEINFAAGGPMLNSQAMTGSSQDTSVPTDELKIFINVAYYSVIDPNDQNGNTRIDNGEYQVYLDRTIAHEMVHAVMFGNGILKNSTPQFFSEGVAELVMGLDDYDGSNTAAIYNLARDTERLSDAMSLAEGTGTADCYTAGYMFLRYLAKQNLNTNVQQGNSSTPVTFSYNGGVNIISDYKTADKIDYSADFTGIDLYDGDLILKSSSGNLYIRDSRNELVNIADADGNIIAYGYMSDAADEINGGSYDKFELIIGANNLSNQITAGSGGSSLWGGNGGNDTLFGGAGTDEFFYSFGNGNDTIQNANSNDIVNLIGVSTSQISNLSVENNIAKINFTDGGSLQVAGDGDTKYKLENVLYAYNNQNSQWTTV